MLWFWLNICGMYEYAKSTRDADSKLAQKTGFYFKAPFDFFRVL